MGGIIVLQLVELKYGILFWCHRPHFENPCTKFIINIKVTLCTDVLRPFFPFRLTSFCESAVEGLQEIHKVAEWIHFTDFINEGKCPCSYFIWKYGHLKVFSAYFPAFMIFADPLIAVIWCGSGVYRSILQYYLYSFINSSTKVYNTNFTSCTI